MAESVFPVSVWRRRPLEGVAAAVRHGARDDRVRGPGLRRLSQGTDNIRVESRGGA